MAVVVALWPGEGARANDRRETADAVKLRRTHIVISPVGYRAGTTVAVDARQHECARVDEDPPSRVEPLSSAVASRPIYVSLPSTTRPSDLVEAALMFHALGKEPRFVSTPFCSILVCNSVLVVH